MRLPVDRVFTIAGAGTVVTGTMWSGSAQARRRRSRSTPAASARRIRGVQVHGAAVDEAHAGQRVAINIAGVERDEIARGDIIAAPGTLTVTDRFDARFTYLGTPGDDKPFETGARVHVHHGTREVLGRVLLMDAERAAPGQSGLAQVRLEEPLAPRYDDRFIVRSYSPVYTIGGGVVLDALPPRRTHAAAPTSASCSRRCSRTTCPSAATGLLGSRGVPMTSAQVAAALGVPRARVADELNRAKLERLKVGGETVLRRRPRRSTRSSPASSASCSRSTRRTRARPASPRARCATASTAASSRRCSTRCSRSPSSAASPRSTAAWSATRRPRSSALAAEADAEAALLPLLERQGLAPASVAELASEAGVDPGIARKVLGRLASDGRVVRVNSELHFSAAAMERREELRRRCARRRIPRARRAAELRDALGVSRKYAIPLLEYFDAQGFTKRVGDLRVLRSRVASSAGAAIRGSAMVKRAPRALDVLGGHRAAVQVDEALRDREAETRPARIARPRTLRAVEAVEDARELVFGDARAVVGDREAHVGRRPQSHESAIVPPSAVCATAFLSTLRSAWSSRSGSPSTHRPAGALDGDRRGRRACATRAGALLEDRADLERLERVHAALEAREREQLVEQAAHALRLRLDHLEALERIDAAERARAQQLDVAAHDRDRRAQLVARVGDEPALLGVGVLEPFEHRVERVGERAELVGGPVVGDALAGRGERDRRRRRRPCACSGRERAARRPDRQDRAEEDDDDARGAERARDAGGDRLGVAVGERDLERAETLAVRREDRHRERAVA